MERTEDLRWLLAAATVLGSGVSGWVLKRLLVGRIARLLRRTATGLDDALLEAVSPLVPFATTVVGVVVAARVARLDPGVAARLDRVAVAALLMAGAIATSSFLARLVTAYASRLPGGLPTTTLTRNAIHLVVIGTGALMVLGQLGVAIAPLLTALGVGSLAVALALQSTLSNLFAGFHVTLARRIRVGDFVELETGQQGVVVDIGWRSTQLRELANNLVVVPNARLAEVIVRNYSLPEEEQAALVQVGVAYGSDLAAVERVTVATARETQREVTGAVEGFEPFIRFHTFGDSAIGLTVILRVRTFVDRYLITHEFVQRLHRRYAEAGIQIPFPQRVVHSADGGGGGA